MTSTNPLRGRSAGPVDHSRGRLARAIALAREVGPLEIIRRIRKSGLLGTARFILRNIRHQIAHAHAHAFDRREGVDTAGSIQLDQLDVLGPHKAIGNEAVSTSPMSFAWLMDHAPLPVDATFIDIGCGKGRTVLLASTRFKHSIGVEFAAELVAVARRNLITYGQRHTETGSAEIVHLDAAAFSFPDGPLVIYLYNPFSEALLRQVIGNLAADLEARPRPCTIVYASGMDTLGWAKRAISESGNFRVQRTGRVPAYWDAIRPLEFAYFVAA